MDDGAIVCQLRARRLAAASRGPRRGRRARCAGRGSRHVLGVAAHTSTAVGQRGFQPRPSLRPRGRIQQRGCPRSTSPGRLEGRWQRRHRLLHRGHQPARRSAPARSPAAFAISRAGSGWSPARLKAPRAPDFSASRKASATSSSQTTGSAAAIRQEAAPHQRAQLMVHAPADEDGRPQARHREVGVLALQRVEHRLHVELGAGVPEAGLARARRILRDRRRERGDHPIRRHRRGVDDAPHAASDRRAKGVAAAAHVHVVLQLPCSAFRHQEGQVHERVAPGQVLAETRIAHVGADVAQLAGDHQRRPYVDGHDLLDPAIVGEPSQDQRAQLAAATGDRDAHGRTLVHPMGDSHRTACYVSLFSGCPGALFMEGTGTRERTGAARAVDDVAGGPDRSEVGPTSLRLLAEQALSRAPAPRSSRETRGAAPRCHGKLSCMARGDRGARGAASRSRATSSRTMRSAAASPMRWARGGARRPGARAPATGSARAARPRRRFWARLRAGGRRGAVVQSLRFEAPLGWLPRNHRKSLVVDGRVGFVTGLCIAARWAGDAERGIPAWRDTGVEIAGPRSPTSRARSRASGREAGPPDPEALVRREEIAAAGDVSLRVVATEPATAGILRLDKLIAALARRTLWLTDAYFVGHAAYVQALRAAAQDGVDVRLLVPGAQRHRRRQAISRPPATARCSRRACASSSGTARCSTPRPPWRTGAGRAWARRTSTSQAGSATGSSTSRSRTPAFARPDGGDLPGGPRQFD